MTLFEARADLGGNAKTHLWELASAPAVRTGLSVLAWPRSLFRYYEALLKTLDIPATEVKPAFVVSEDDHTASFVHQTKQSRGVSKTAGEAGSNRPAPEIDLMSPEANAKWHADMVKWDRCIRTLRITEQSTAFVVRGLVAAWLLLSLPARLVLRLLRTYLRSTKTFHAPQRCNESFGSHDDASYLSPTAMLAECASAWKAPTDLSVYSFSPINPFNFVRAKFAMRSLFGVSQEFWDVVVTGIYSSSFLTAHLNDLPAAVLVSLDMIISVGATHPVRPLNTWAEGFSSQDVFQRMTRSFETVEADRCCSGTKTTDDSSPKGRGSLMSGGKHRLALNAKISRITFRGPGDRCLIQFQIEPPSRSLIAPTVRVEEFDRVVFACPATVIAEVTRDAASRPTFLLPCLRDVASTSVPFRSTLFETMIPNVRYECQRDNTFTLGFVHSQRGVIPKPLQASFFAEGFSNYVLVKQPSTPLKNKDAPPEVTNVFALGTWVPNACASARSCRIDAHDFYVSYNDRHVFQGGTPSSSSPLSHGSNGATAPVDRVQLDDGTDHPTFKRVDNRVSHPVLSLLSLSQSFFLRRLQGRRGAYYCGNFTTPGNGHDLSCISGALIAFNIAHDLFASSRRADAVNDGIKAPAELTDASKPVGGLNASPSTANHALPLSFARQLARCIFVCNRAEDDAASWRDVTLLAGLMGLDATLPNTY